MELRPGLSPRYYPQTEAPPIDNSTWAFEKARAWLEQWTAETRQGFDDWKPTYQQLLPKQLQ